MKNQYKELDKDCVDAFVKGNLIISFEKIKKPERREFIKEFLEYCELLNLFWVHDNCEPPLRATEFLLSEMMGKMVMIKHYGGKRLVWYTSGHRKFELTKDEVYMLKVSDFESLRK